MARRQEIALALAAAAVAASCTGDLEPYGEVVVVVDTDLPVPALAARLRMDVFDDGGTWLTSHDFGLTAPADWPASFSVFTRDESGPREVLLRLRAYPEGKVRDYLGERYAERPTFVEPPFATTLDELCATLPALVFGQELTLRRGQSFVTDVDPGPECGKYLTLSGAVAARVLVTEPGTYRFEVLHDTAGDSTLVLRTQCADESSQIACSENADDEVDWLPSIALDLQPGDYTLVAMSPQPISPAEVTLRGARAEAWEDLPEVPQPSVVPNTPRLVQDGIDVTPLTEPQPRVTVDRLLRVELVPGRVAEARVTLRGACTGTMARLAATASFERVSLEEADTCIDEENVRVRVLPAALVDPISPREPSPRGTFAVGAPCPAANDGEVVCVPGGPFVLGSVYGTVLDSVPLPERTAAVSTFWIDRHEVTVARFRAATDAGLEVPGLGPQGTDFDPFCKWTPAPGSEEDYAMACLDWYGARAYCQFVGGDLPTEAQWEYVASAAARPFETRYPASDRRPTCDEVVFDREPGGECFDSGSGPLPVGARDSTDRTPVLGVVGLAGNLFEWTRDSAHAYDHPCWDAAGLVDPDCFEESAPLRFMRGGAWPYGVDFTKTTVRLPSTQVGTDFIGFRCAYAEAP